MRCGQAFARRVHLLSVHPQTAPPQHPLEAEPQRLSRHLWRDLDVSFILSLSDITHLASQVPHHLPVHRSVLVEQPRLQRGRHTDARHVQRAREMERCRCRRERCCHLPLATQVLTLLCQCPRLPQADESQKSHAPRAAAAHQNREMFLHIAFQFLSLLQKYIFSSQLANKFLQKTDG